MIDPELNDWWSHKHLTKLEITGTSLRGAGVSVQVLTKAFDENEFIWFTSVTGEFNDNLLLVAIENNAADNWIKIRSNRHDIEPACFGQTLNNEFKITDEIASELGLTIGKTDFDISNRQRVLFSISSHDNCFFLIEPISAEMTKRVIHAILQQHSYYLGKEIHWDAVEPQLVDILWHNKEINIESDPRRDCVWIPQYEIDHGWYPNHSREGSITLLDAKAHFRE